MDLFHVRLLFSPRSDGGVSALSSYSPPRTLCPTPYRSTATPMQYRLACRRRALQTVIVFRKPYRATTHMCSLDRERYSRAVRVGLSIVNWRQHRLTTSISSRLGIFGRPPFGEVCPGDAIGSMAGITFSGMHPIRDTTSFYHAGTLRSHSAAIQRLRRTDASRTWHVIA